MVNMLRRMLSVILRFFISNSANGESVSDRSVGLEEDTRKIIIVINKRGWAVYLMFATKRGMRRAE